MRPRLPSRPFALLSFASAVVALSCDPAGPATHQASMQSTGDGAVAFADDAGARDSGAADASAPDGGTADAGSDAGAVRPAPVLLSAVAISHGTNALSWSLPTGGCSLVRLNRKRQPGAYAVVQTLTGVATSAQDSPGHSAGTYCYTITCVDNGEESPPSNERCVSQ